MITAQVSDKGQITIPAAVRKELGLKAKSRVEIEIRDKTAVIKPMLSILDLSGILHDRLKVKTLDWQTERTEMEQIVGEQVANEGLD